MESKPVYRIRKNGKQDVFEGTLEDVRKWLRQNSINSADEMRRSGYAVLELDEFWGLVSDFPELAMTERQGRGVMIAKIRKARHLMVAAVVLALGAICLFAYDRWLPVLEVTLDKSKYEDALAEKDRALKAAIDAKGKEMSAALNTLKADYAQQLAAKDSALNELKSKSGQQQLMHSGDLLAKEKELGRISSEAVNFKKRADEFESRLVDSAQRISSLVEENTSLKSQVTRLKDRKGKMPITASLERKTFGGYRLNLWNFSTYDYPVQVIVKGADSSGKTYSKAVTVARLEGIKPGQGEISDNIDSGDEIVIKPLSEDGLDIIELSAPE
jgi:hypothetical protein